MIFLGDSVNNRKNGGMKDERKTCEATEKRSAKDVNKINVDISGRMNKERHLLMKKHPENGYNIFS